MIARVILEAIFPSRCLSCGKNGRGNFLCPRCAAGVAISRRLPAPLAPERGFFAGAAASYEDPPVRAAVRGLKFRGLKDAATPLAELLCRYIAAQGLTLKGHVAIPVPLGRQRERGRGFNQSALIARSVAGRLGLAIVEDALFRARETKPQSETKTAAERRENVKGCFVADAARVPRANVLLIDDVTTTGATFAEAARVLRAAGAPRVIALAAAQA